MSDLGLTSTDSRKKKCSIHFIFFYLLCFKKYIYIPNSEFWKKKKKKQFVGYIFWFYLHEPRSSQAIEPPNWDPETRPFQDPSIWVTDPLSEALSHDLTKPSWDLSLEAKNPSHRTFEPRCEPSRVEPHFELYFVTKLEVLLKLHLEFEGECYGILFRIPHSLEVCLLLLLLSYK